jgi:hypothetical protein
MRALPCFLVYLLGAGCGLDDVIGGEDTVHGLGGGHAEPFDPWDALEREQREGPPRYTSRVHACPKPRYATIGNVLASRGVDLAATAETSAGAIYRASAAALGAPSYAGRVRETLELGVAISAKMFDLYLAAAPEILANLGATAACPGVALFSPDGRCNPDGVTCLIGVPATAEHLDVCDHMVASTTAAGGDLATGQALAVAALAAAAHTCE